MMLEKNYLIRSLELCHCPLSIYEKSVSTGVWWRVQHKHNFVPGKIFVYCRRLWHWWRWSVLRDFYKHPFWFMKNFLPKAVLQAGESSCTKILLKYLFMCRPKRAGRICIELRKYEKSKETLAPSRTVHSSQRWREVISSLGVKGEKRDAIPSEIVKAQREVKTDRQLVSWLVLAAPSHFERFWLQKTDLPLLR